MSWSEERRIARRAAYQQFMASPVWREIRRERLVLAEYRCEGCDLIAHKRPDEDGPRCDFYSSPVDPDTPGLHVHHLRYDRFGGLEQASDLQVLCPRHHGLLTLLEKSPYCRACNEPVLSDWGLRDAYWTNLSERYGYPDGQVPFDSWAEVVGAILADVSDVCAACAHMMKG